MKWHFTSAGRPIVLLPSMVRPPEWLRTTYVPLDEVSTSIRVQWGTRSHLEHTILALAGAVDSVDKQVSIVMSARVNCYFGYRVVGQWMHHHLGNPFTGSNNLVQQEDIQQQRR